jgi:hypothetical protein
MVSFDIIKTFEFEDPLLAAMGMKIDCPQGSICLTFTLYSVTM